MTTDDIIKRTKGIKMYGKREVRVSEIGQQGCVT